MVSVITQGLMVTVMQCLGVGGGYLEGKVSETSLINDIRGQKGSCYLGRKTALPGMTRFGCRPNSSALGSVASGKSRNLSESLSLE